MPAPRPSFLLLCFFRAVFDFVCSYIKLMQESGTAFALALPSPDLSLQTRVVKVAHDHGLLAVGHATSIEDALILLRAGVDGLMHVPHDGLPSDELINLFLNHGAFVTPTLATYCSGSGESESTLAFSRNEQVQDKLDHKSKEIIKTSFAFPGYAGKMTYAYEWVRRLKAAGVDIIWLVSSHPRWWKKSLQGEFLAVQILLRWFLGRQWVHLFITSCRSTSTTAALRQLKPFALQRPKRRSDSDWMIVAGL
jgi:hypothetical protein